MTVRATMKLEPLGLRREDAAAFLGLSPTTFDRMVSAGELPKAINLKSARVSVWDRRKLDEAFSTLSGWVPDGADFNEWDRP